MHKISHFYDRLLNIHVPFWHVHFPNENAFCCYDLINLLNFYYNLFLLYKFYGSFWSFLHNYGDCRVFELNCWYFFHQGWKSSIWWILCVLGLKTQIGISINDWKGFLFIPALALIQNLYKFDEVKKRN